MNYITNEIIKKSIPFMSGSRFIFNFDTLPANTDNLSLIPDIITFEDLKIQELKSLIIDSRTIAKIPMPYTAMNLSLSFP